MDLGQRGHNGDMEEREAKRHQRLKADECPAGVKDGVEDRVEQWRQNLRYGVVLGEIPFWEWMSGEQGLTHTWTTGRAPDIVAKRELVGNGRIGG